MPGFFFNKKASLTERVMDDLVGQHHLDTSAIQITPYELEREYTYSEAIGAEQLDLDDVDIVVALSGRAGFTGMYEETKDKHIFCPNVFDPTDTLRRVEYAKTRYEE